MYQKKSLIILGSKKYGENEKQSVLQNTLIVIEMNPPAMYAKKEGFEKLTA